MVFHLVTYGRWACSVAQKSFQLCDSWMATDLLLLLIESRPMIIKQELYSPDFVSVLNLATDYTLLMHYHKVALFLLRNIVVSMTILFLGRMEADENV